MYDLPINSLIKQTKPYMVLLSLLLSSLLLAACTANDADMPAPAGAAKGQNTFLLFFADN